MSSKKKKNTFDPDRLPTKWEEFTGLDVYKLINSGKNTQEITKRFNISLSQLIHRLTCG